jgi:phosphate:Na+ symporter
MSIIFIIFNTLGGLAIFLYGLFILSTGFKKIFFQKLKKILEKLTDNPVKGAGLGAFITSVIQSSSITVVTLIGLLNAGLLNLNQAIGVMLGAEIGTTITAQLVAFKIGIYYFPFITIGFILWFFSKTKKFQYLGQIIFGFGILFLGMATMSQGAKLLKDMPFFIDMLVSFGQFVPLGILAGALFTALIQSSSATTGLVIAMGMEGVISLPSSIALILGANIGTCVTGFFASIKSGKSSKRLFAAQFAVNIIGVFIFALLILPFSKMVALTSQNLPRQIANAHTIFNVLVSLAAIPLIGFLVILVKKMVPGQVIKIDRGLKFLNDKILNIPSVAIFQAQKEILRMADIAKDMLKQSKETIFQKQESVIRAVKEKEAIVDEIHHLLDSYLTKISTLAISDKESQKLALLMHSVTDIERIADHANNIVELSEFRTDKKIKFSDLAAEELRKMFDKVIEGFSQSILALEKDSKESAKNTLAIEREVNCLDEQLEKNHYCRLEEGVCAPAAGPLYLEIVSNLERISDHAENIAGGIIMGF